MYPAPPTIKTDMGPPFLVARSRVLLGSVPRPGGEDFRIASELRFQSRRQCLGELSRARFRDQVHGASAESTPRHARTKDARDAAGQLHGEVELGAADFVVI